MGMLLILTTKASRLRFLLASFAEGVPLVGLAAL